MPLPTVRPGLRPRVGVAKRGSNVRYIVMLIVAVLAFSVLAFLFVTLFMVSEWDDNPARVLKDAPVPMYGQSGLNAMRDAEPGVLAAAGAADAPRIKPRVRKIVLSTGGGRINTGVWPSWGSTQNDEPAVLNWAAAGVKVQKMCGTQCVVTHDQTDVDDADAVVIETVNYPKFGVASAGISWPNKRANPRSAVSAEGGSAYKAPALKPLTVMFYFEPAAAYPQFTSANKELVKQFDMTMTPDGDATLPVTLTCPWGHPVHDFLEQPRPKTAGHFIAYFNEHGVAGEYREYIDKFFALAGANHLHSYQRNANRAMPPEAGGDPYQLENRIKYLSTYKFALITEFELANDWIEPELSQTLLAGVVPIYIGAPNVASYMPGPRSMIHVRDFPTPEALWAALQPFLEESEEMNHKYADFFSWKGAATSAFFADENGADNPYGMGFGVSPPRMTPAELAHQLQYWAYTPNNVRSMEDLAASVDAVSSVQDPLLSFQDVSMSAWRSFRRKLDHCVHYAECRLCELVTAYT